MHCSFLKSEVNSYLDTIFSHLSYKTMVFKFPEDTEPFFITTSATKPLPLALSWVR